jgi:gluconolactonase
MFNAAGELVACEMEGRLVAWNLRTNARRVLADSYGGKRFNSPNDLVIDRQGGIYFTDPRYTAPQPLPQGSECVYYVAANGNICRVIENLPGPNGVLLSTDENILYVLPMDDPKMLAYTIKSPGTVTDARVFCTLAVREHDVVPGCDGATLDERGNLYLTTVAGVEVYSPAGDHLIVIKLPEKPSNVAFGGHSFTTLYATSRTSVYAVPMNVAGHRYAQSGQASTTP